MRVRKCYPKTVTFEPGPAGKVSVYDRCHWVGRGHVGESVWVSLDPDTTEWVIMDERGGVLKRVAAAELTAERICRLAVSRERGTPTGDATWCRDFKRNSTSRNKDSTHPTRWSRTWRMHQ